MRRFALVLSATFLTSFGVLAASADTVVTDRAYERYEWRASTFAVSSQHQAALDVDRAGRIVAVWSSRRQQEGRAGVYAQRFTPDGVALGGETAVGLEASLHQTNPAVAVDGQGNTWIVWESFGQDGQAGAIIARRFGSDFKGGSEIGVNQRWRGHQSGPVVAVSQQGVVLIVWNSAVLAQEGTRLRARLFNADGSPRGDEFAVSTARGRSERIPSVTSGSGGGFAVVFSVFDGNMKTAGIHMQRFDVDGSRLGEEVVVSDPAKIGSIEPAVAATPDGYVVTWLDAQSDGSDYGVVARRFDAEGCPLGAPFVVNATREGPQNAAAITAAADGRFVIAWNSADGDDAGVYAQMFAADGTRRGSEFRINRTTAGKQALHIATGTRRLAQGPSGELYCVWTGDAGLGDKSSVNVTMLSPQSLELAGRSQGITDDMRSAARAPARTAAAEPHRPPTFDPQHIEEGDYEVRRDGRFGFTAVNSTGWTPPDPHMAVGPDHIVVMTNGAIAFFDKDGTKTFQDEIENSYGFWGALGATGFVFDPEVLYDELSGRFLAMAAEAYAPPDETRSYVLVAVSDDSNPNGTWHKYRFDTTALAGYLFDSPNIGVDNEAVYITGDGFGYGANYPVYTFDKASLLAGDPPAVQRSLTLSTSTQSAGIPPVSFDDPPALYMVEHAENFTSTTVRLIALRDPLGAPYFNTYTLAVPAYGRPEDPPQYGTSSRPETFDARFWSAAYRDGSLWATHHVNASRVRARWYEIAMNGWPTSGQNPQLVQSGEIDPGGQVRTFFNSITVNGRGDAAITCSRSSPTEYISMITAVRYKADPLGTFRTPEDAHDSYQPDTSERWGDYSAINPDPGDIDVFWAHHEYRVTSWRTWVQQVVLPSRIGDLNCDGVVDFGDINPFVLALTDPAGYNAAYPDCEIMNGDINDDGEFDFGDINPFVALLGAG